MSCGSLWADDVQYFLLKCQGSKMRIFLMGLCVFLRYTQIMYKQSDLTCSHTGLQDVNIFPDIVPGKKSM